MKATFTRPIVMKSLGLLALCLRMTSSFAESLEPQPASAPCTPIVYNLGQGTRGTISTPGEKDCYSFTGEAGHRIDVYSFRFAAAQQSLELIGPDSSVLAACGFTDGDCEIENVTLPVTGDYALIVEFEGDATGDYLFFLHRLDGDEEPISFGQVLTNDIHPPGDQDGFFFDGQANQRITALLLSQLATGMSLRLIAPNGESLAFSDFSSYSQIDNVLLPATGTYSLIVDGRWDYMDRYSLALNRLDGDAEPILYNQSLQREISPMGDQDRFIFSGALGQRVTVFLKNQTTGSLSLQLSSSDGRGVAFCDFSDADCQLDEIVLPDTDAYTLTVDGEGETNGGYTLALNLLDSQSEPISYDQSLLREISPSGDQDSFNFNGEAGQRITIFLGNQTPGGLSLRLNHPDGLTHAHCDFTHGDCQMDNISLPATGVYTVTIDGEDDAFGNYLIALNRLDSERETIAYGESLLRELSPAGDQDDFAFAGVADDRVTALLENHILPGSRLALHLIKPDGSTLALCDFSEIGCRIDDVSLPESGIYTLRVDGYYGAVGEYTLSLPNPTEVQEGTHELPGLFALKQNYPNPFNPATTFYFEVPELAHVTIKIFDLHGREVFTLADRTFVAGRHMETWDGRMNDGTLLMSGEYFVQMRTTGFVSVKKLLLVR